MRHQRPGYHERVLHDVSGFQFYVFSVFIFLLAVSGMRWNTGTFAAAFIASRESTRQVATGGGCSARLPALTGAAGPEVMSVARCRIEP